MILIDNWRKLWLRLWTIRLTIFCGVLNGALIGLAAFIGWFHPITYLLLNVVGYALLFALRLIKQPEIHE